MYSARRDTLIGRCNSLEASLRRTRNVFRAVNWCLYGSAFVTHAMIAVVSLIAIVEGSSSYASYITLAIGIIGSIIGGTYAAVDPASKATSAMQSLVEVRHVHSRVLAGDVLEELESKVAKLEMSLFNDTMPLYVNATPSPTNIRSAPAAGPVRDTKTSPMKPGMITVKVPSPKYSL